MVKLRRILLIVSGVLLAAASVLTLFLPFPAALGTKAEVYLCTWDDGTITEENYLTAYSALEGVAEDGLIELKRGGHVGEIPVSEAFSERNAILSDGSLSELLSLGRGELSRLGQAALFREYGSAVYYSADEFRYTGEGIVHDNLKRAEKVILLSGALPANYLAEMGAGELRIAAVAEFSADRLLGSNIGKITAAAPYFTENDALYLGIAGQTRLVAAVPAAEELELSESDYADEGALLPCTALTSLTIPYAGNARRSIGTSYDGTFAWLFSSSEGFSVPESLKKVTVTGGQLVSRCFYACPKLEEVNACKLSASDIEIDAFADMVGWKTVHSPKSDIILTGNYTAHTAPCGCTVFERIEEKK